MSFFSFTLKSQFGLIALMAVAFLFQGCSTFSGNRRLPVSHATKDVLLYPFTEPTPQVFDPDNKHIKVFVVSFDGTMNDRERIPPNEDKTVVAKLYEEIYESLAPYRGESVEVKYFPGPGMASPYHVDLFDALIGYSCAPTANKALAELQTFLLKNPLSADDELRIVVIGFSRGAATARHFLNMVYTKANTGQLTSAQVWSSAILMDTVATFQSHLDLALPPNVEWAIHIVAKSDARIFFRPIIDDDSQFMRSLYLLKADSLFDPSYRRIKTIVIPGAHSNIGDSYSFGIGPFITFKIKNYLNSMGFLAQPEEDFGPHLQEGLVDSRGVLDKLLGAPSPYSCSFERKLSHVVPSTTRDEEKVRLSERLFARRNDVLPISGSFKSFQNTLNMRFGAKLNNTQWDVIPDTNPEYIAATSAAASRNKNGTVTLKIEGGKNNGKSYVVPKQVVSALANKENKFGVIELAGFEEKFWWFLDDCLPME